MTWLLIVGAVIAWLAIRCSPTASMFVIMLTTQREKR